MTQYSIQFSAFHSTHLLALVVDSRIILGESNEMHGVVKVVVVDVNWLQELDS